MSEGSESDDEEEINAAPSVAMHILRDFTQSRYARELGRMGYVK